MQLRDLIEDTNSDTDKFLLAYNAPSLEQFKAKDFAKAKAQLLRKKEKANA